MNFTAIIQLISLFPEPKFDYNLSFQILIGKLSTFGMYFVKVVKIRKLNFMKVIINEFYSKHKIFLGVTEHPLL